MPYIDTHCHFNFSPFVETLEQSLDRFRQAKVKGLIIPATQATDFTRLLSLAQSTSDLFPAVGLHPLWTSVHRHEDITQLEMLLAQHQSIVAVGEIGLDFFNTELVNLAAQQTEYLEAQLCLAKQHRLPVILHSRRSHDQLAKILRQAELSARGVVHGFSGSYQQAKRFIELGYFIGVGGTITYPRANKTRETIRQLPLESLVLETDAPDMPLFGFQGEANRPEQVIAVCEALAELRGESVNKVMNATWNNSLRLFPRLAATFPVLA